MLAINEDNNYNNNSIINDNNKDNTKNNGINISQFSSIALNTLYFLF